jgi:hypothetical protein
MSWEDILKGRPNEYFIRRVLEDFDKKINKLEERFELLMEKFVMERITDEEDKEMDKINIQLRDLKRKRDEFERNPKSN